MANFNPPPSRDTLGQARAKAYAGSLIPALIFVLFLALAYQGTQSQPSLAVDAERCDVGWCASSLFPAGRAWEQGVSTGDRVLAVDGEPLVGSTEKPDLANAATAEFLKPDGTSVTASASKGAVTASGLRVSMWLVASAFAFLGALVWFRRPDLPSAAGFLAFTFVAAFTTAIAPVAGGVAVRWGLGVQAVGVIITVPAFAYFLLVFLREQGIASRGSTRVVKVYAGISGLVLVGYGASLMDVRVYDFVRPALALSLVAGLFLCAGLLAKGFVAEKGFRPSDRVLKAPLIGVGLGVLPLSIFFVTLATGTPEVIPPRFAILPVALIPASFAYAILTHQLWGIRRLIHRGLVYALVSAVLLSFVVAGVALSSRLSGADSGTTGDLVVAGVLVVMGITAYSPLLRGARRLVDRLFYSDTPSYSEFVQGLQQDLTQADIEGGLAATLGEVLCERLDLEAMVLMTMSEDGQDAVGTRYGEGADRVVEAVKNERLRLSDVGRDGAPVIVPLDADQVIAVRLTTSTRDVGTLLLGPKRGGELFVTDEVNLILGAAPFIAMALDRDELSATMRQLNRRLVETEERERAKMAMDLHDGPLQKAVALAWDRAYAATNPKEVALELVDELREFGSRLRPSILDDLGLPSSIEWLLDSSLRGTDIAGTLALDDIDEDGRLPSDIELTLFRVTQEALNNAVKHSSAQALTVHLGLKGDVLCLKVQDNGVGIGGVGSGRIPSSRLGMVGMRERVMQVGGDLLVESDSGNGVTIQVTVPLTSEAVASIREQHGY